MSVTRMHELMKTVNSVDFWVELFNDILNLGPLVPILLAAMESILPPIPLIGVVTFNVMGYGPFWGFLLSWLGTCLGSTAVFLFFRWIGKKWLHDWLVAKPKGQKAIAWVNKRTFKALFLVSIMPFTPSSFVNFAFGISDFDGATFLLTIWPAKAVMVGFQVLFGTSLVAGLDNPWLLLACAGMVVLFYFVTKAVNRHHGLK